MENPNDCPRCGCSYEMCVCETSDYAPIAVERIRRWNERVPIVDEAETQRYLYVSSLDVEESIAEIEAYLGEAEAGGTGVAVLSHLHVALRNLRGMLQ